MSEEAQANIYPDGSQDFESTPMMDETVPPPVTMDQDEIPFDTMGDTDTDETMQQLVKGIDPAIYLLIATVLVAALLFYMHSKSKKSSRDDFFAELDGDKVSVEGVQ